jgi:mannose-6-phosphate isomerase-like protein (cupin superfamily)
MVTKLKYMSIAVFISTFLMGSLAQSAESEPLTVNKILDSFVADFANDAYARPMHWGFEVDGIRSHMAVSRSEDGVLETAHIAGFPDRPILYWIMSEETLRRLDAGLNGETATTRARADDPYLLRTSATPGFPAYTVNQSLNDFTEQLRLHFWTRGTPEIFELNRAASVLSHGGNVVGLVYGEDLRTVWYEIMPGQHVNEDPKDQVNDFNSLYIVTQGEAKAKFDGKLVKLEANKAYLIPAGMTHEFWNDGDASLEFVLIMYGDGA